jgi:putative RecB family exonuclease
MSKKKHSFSYSQLGTYSSCPQKYKLIYIDKIYKKHDSIEAFMGKVVHEVLEWLYNDKFDYCIWDHIEEKYNQIWDEKWHDDIFIAQIKKQYDTKHFKKMGLECLRNYYKLNGGPTIDYSNVKGVEMKIEFKIDSFNFKTVIDRLDDDGESIAIHDYKAGKPKTARMLRKDLQLFIYMKAVQSIDKSNKEITLNWHYLKEKDPAKQHIKIIKTDVELAEHKEDLLNQINQIIDARKTNLFPAKESFLCNWCYFWDECEGMPEQYYKNELSIRAKRII